MTSKQGLMTALVGIAMIAMPITAKAGDHGRHWRSAQGVRSFQGTRFMGPPVAGGGGTRYMGPPAGGGGEECEYEHHDNGRHLGWYKHRDFGNGSGAGYVCDDDGDDCRPAGSGYQQSGYGYGVPVNAYPSPVAYQAPYYGSGFAGAPVINPYLGGGQGNLMSAKAQAQAQLQAAIGTRNRGAIRAARRNLNVIDRQIARTNVRTTGAPYAGYGANAYQQPLHKRLLNGLLGGNAYNAAPAYGNPLAYNNYNNGAAIPGIAAYQNQGYAGAPAYGTPYAGGGATSMLAPLLGSFIH
jgi:hypothetical protein